jgi:hypothetical protein
MEYLKGKRTLILAALTALVNGAAAMGFTPQAYPEIADLFNLYILPPLMVWLRLQTTGPALSKE